MRSILDCDILTIMREKIKKIAAKYEPIGFYIVGIFGSQKEGGADVFSDVDIAYKIDHELFFPNDAFKKLIALEEIKNQLQKALQKRVDLVPYNEKLEVELL